MYIYIKECVLHLTGHGDVEFLKKKIFEKKFIEEKAEDDLLFSKENAMISLSKDTFSINISNVSMDFKVKLEELSEIIEGCFEVRSILLGILYSENNNIEYKIPVQGNIKNEEFGDYTLRIYNAKEKTCFLSSEIVENGPYVNDTRIQSSYNELRPYTKGMLDRIITSIEEIIEDGRE